MPLPALSNTEDLQALLEDAAQRARDAHQPAQQLGDELLQRLEDGGKFIGSSRQPAHENRVFSR